MKIEIKDYESGKKRIIRIPTFFVTGRIAYKFLKTMLNKGKKYTKTQTVEESAVHLEGVSNVQQSTALNKAGSPTNEFTYKMYKQMAKALKVYHRENGPLTLVDVQSRDDDCVKVII
ncbi:MAG: hypothetical protein IJ322_01015 [Clostridia bacterium]|nr:hypothetical protein [Clostridia bacterium]